MPIGKGVGAICDQQFRVDWKVENFYWMSARVNANYYSPVFQFLGRSFYLHLYPNGDTLHNSKGWLGLFLTLNESCPPMEIEYTFGVKTSEGKIEDGANLSSTFEREDTGFGKTDCLKRSDLLFRKQELAPSDALLITVSMKANVPQPVARTTSEVGVQTSPDGDDESRLPEKTGREKVCEDLEKLWSSSDNSDVTVKVGDVEFKAHKTILGARTPVLRAMFKHDTEEKESGVVTITDCQPNIFEEFLRYVYTGSTQELTSKNAFGLYALAEKYLVDDLKTQCLRHVRNSLCVETFCNAYLLALTHEEAELLEQAVDFAAENIRLIIRSVEWQKFNEEHPTEATEILIKALGPHESRKS